MILQSAKGGTKIAKSKNEVQREYEKRTGYAAQNKYHKENTKSFVIRMMINTEQDIIDWLEKQPNKAGYIKALIRADMESVSKKSTPPTNTEI